MDNSLNDQKNREQMAEELLFKQLKDILLKEDREKIEEIHTTIHTEERLTEKVAPILEEQLNQLKTNFPEEYKIVVDKMIAEKIQNSKQEIINLLFPELGIMIKNYVGLQIQMLKESIENQFGSKGLLGKIKSSLGFGSSSEEVIQNLEKPVVEEIFIIQKNSGLLAGSATRNKTIDQDVIAGMMTAIKSFVEDAFKRGNENLGVIEYDTYRIVMQNFPNWYFAVALSGTLTTKERDELSNRVLNFVSNQMPSQIESITEDLNSKLSRKLKIAFIDNI